MVGVARQLGLFGWKHDPEKVESMASIFILGGFVPLAWSYAIHRDTGDFARCEGCLLENGLYMVGIVAGALSLLPKRGSRSWRLVVALSGAIFVATTCQGVKLSVGNSVWSFVVLCLTGLQFRRDVKAC
jgi:hypothetical protein